MVFVNEKEININKSSVLSKFCGVNSIQKFLQMKIPIKNTSNPNEINTEYKKFN